jgi:hypothetical protein|eukprot:COSAG06_NODE_23235_length_698_cov_8.510851_2_plen_70_part_00
MDAAVGYIAKACTPTHSGFDTFLGYYEACNHDLFYHTCGKCSPQTCGRMDNGAETHTGSPSFFHIYEFL